MVSKAVITGSAVRVDDVARAFERNSISVVPIHQGDNLEQAASLVDASSLDYYVQLPEDFAELTHTRRSALTTCVSHAMLRRDAELKVLLPKLAPRGAVVLVTGETETDELPGGFSHAPTLLFDLLAEAITTDLSPLHVQATVADHQCSPDQIADLAMASGPLRSNRAASFAAEAPEMNYDDWKLAYLAQAGPEI